MKTKEYSSNILLLKENQLPATLLLYKNEDSRDGWLNDHIKFEWIRA